MSKSIAIFSNFFPPHIGGVEYYSLGLANYFSDNGYDVYVVTTTNNNYQNNKKYRILVLESYQLINNRFPIIVPSKKNNEIFKFLNSIPLIGAVVQTRFYILSIKAVQYLEKKNVPYLLIEHGTGHFSFSNKLVNKIGEGYEHIITAYIKKHCQNFYGVSNASCKWLEHFHIEAKGVLYNAINRSDYLNETLKKSYSDGIIKIAFVGRLVKEKGIDKLVNAFKNVHEIISNTHLYIAGTGEMYEYYKNRIQKSISFLGGISHEEVLDLLKICDIYCFPSDYPEGLPTTILEAAASKTFIITSKSGGVLEFICSEEYGAILQKNSVSEITEIILKYIKCEEERRRIGNNAYKRVMDIFTWEVVGDQILVALDAVER